LDERERDGGMKKERKQAAYHMPPTYDMICHNVTLGKPIMPIMWENALIAPSKNART